jgi:hypothetical protein
VSAVLAARRGTLLEEMAAAAPRPFRNCHGPAEVVASIVDGVELLSIAGVPGNVRIMIECARSPTR